MGHWRSSVVLVAVLAACTPAAEAPPPPAAEPEEPTGVAALGEALSFHASFDGGTDAAFARGDGTLFTAPSYDALDEAAPGIGNPDVRLVEGAGLFGDALEFAAKNRHAIYYPGEGNVSRGAEGWSGAISLWLKLDPASDLEPGYCDPFQITDAAYNDAAVWVDFSKENPRMFRLGVFGDLHEWNPEEGSGEDFAPFAERLVVMEEPPFSREAWTHVVATWSGLGSGEGRATLYVDGRPVADPREGITEGFTWDDPGAIRLGLSYVGLMDEVAVFDRELTADEVAALHSLEGGVADLHS